MEKINQMGEHYSLLDSLGIVHSQTNGAIQRVIISTHDISLNCL